MHPSKRPATTGARREHLTQELRLRIVGRLYLGLLSYGDRVGSIREVAAEFGVDPRLVLAAYRELDREGLVELRNRSGIFVAWPHALGHGGTAQHAEWMTRMLLEARARNIPAPAVAQLAQRSVASRRLRAAVVDSVEDQIWCMCDELTRDFGLDATAVDLETVGSAAGSAFQGADLIVTSGFHGAAVKELARPTGIPVFAVTMFTELFSEIRRLLQRERVFLVVTDPRFRRKLEQIFASGGQAERLTVLVHGHDRLGDIPPSAPYYVTRLTRQRMNGSPWCTRSLPDARVFTPECAAEIMSFVVRSNLSGPVPDA